MPGWKAVRVKKELVDSAKRTLEKNGYKSLSKFVSEAIRLHLKELEQNREKISKKHFEYPVIQERLLYSSNHIWAMVTPEGKVRVGLSNYAKRCLKGIVHIKTDPVGCKVTKKKPFGVIETWMFMFDLFSPVSGKIVRINEVLKDDSFLNNGDPSDLAWIAEIKPNHLIALEEELRSLMKPHQYKKFVINLERAILK